MVLLGPSGCGKTTLLRCLAGLERPDAGRISVGGTVVLDTATKVDVPTHKRDIGMVFQNYALWPHMTVGQNVTYPLHCRGVKGAVAIERARKALAVVECEGYVDRLPAALSGGQQQRIALARAMVAEPGLMLFDEPLSNLDYRLRAQLRQDIRELHRELGFTGVYVTHDQTEALQIGSQVAVMKDGKLEQLAEPATVFTHPASPYVASFLGISNAFSITRSGAQWLVDGEEGMSVDLALYDLSEVAYDLYVRASEVQLLVPGSAPRPGDALVRINGGRVVDVIYSGESSEWLVEIGGLTVRASAPARTWPFTRGDQVDLGFDAWATLLYTKDMHPSLVTWSAQTQPVA
ncbi:MAG: hypothetical protein ABS81_02775 [Pseudonocardia sp. SCN 72-86]|nr:MAG: hypothetical protein ABS81_02775 [Pseudonocardia sp. SCN 72-86]